MRRNAGLFAILVGGAVAGAIDITYAIVFSGFRGVPAARILQSVASGLLGAASYRGGAPAAALGLFLHFMIAFIWATLFYLASRWSDLLIRYAVVSGILYGILIYAAMNFVVLPLSAFPGRFTFVPVVVIGGVLVHMFGVGLPIALATRRGSARS
jgi:hypothetical protein